MQCLNGLCARIALFISSLNAVPRAVIYRNTCSFASYSSSCGRCIAAPPLWRESASCATCTRAFGVTRYRHHCRACGASVCQMHSTRARALPRLGFLTPVRDAHAHTHRIWSMIPLPRYHNTRQQNFSVLVYVLCVRESVFVFNSNFTHEISMARYLVVAFSRCVAATRVQTPSTMWPTSSGSCGGACGSRPTSRAGSCCRTLTWPLTPTLTKPGGCSRAPCL